MKTLDARVLASLLVGRSFEEMVTAIQEYGDARVTEEREAIAMLSDECSLIWKGSKRATAKSVALADFAKQIRARGAK